jgi:peptide/nickel transport system ATP-binding protein
MLALALMGLLPEGARTRGEALLAPRNGTGPGATKNLLVLDEHEWRGVRGRDIAMVFQEPMTSLNPVMRVGAQVEEAVRAHAARLPRRESKRRAIAALERAAVPEPRTRARQYPHQLSGGLRQRAMIAMALAGGSQDPLTKLPAGPRLLIADEPTTALDATVQKQILELLGRLRSELGLALIFITHDLGVVAQVADRLAVMYAGRIVEEGPAGEVLAHPRHPYTSGLLAASPRLRRSALQPIPGSVPRLDALPPGCAFEPRCPLRQVECSARVPEMRTAGKEHRARCILV